jgi:hypothetical protein
VPPFCVGGGIMTIIIGNLTLFICNKSWRGMPRHELFFPTIRAGLHTGFYLGFRVFGREFSLVYTLPVGLGYHLAAYDELCTIKQFYDEAPNSPKRNKKKQKL